MGAQVVAISADDLETQKKFKAKIGAVFPFVADPSAKIIALYDVKLPILTAANRVTFVIAPDGKITSITKGSDAVDPTAAIDAAETACGL